MSRKPNGPHLPGFQKRNTTCKVGVLTVLLCMRPGHGHDNDNALWSGGLMPTYLFIRINHAVVHCRAMERLLSRASEHLLTPCALRDQHRITVLITMISPSELSHVLHEHERARAWLLNLILPKQGRSRFIGDKTKSECWFFCRTGPCPILLSRL
jgi:hypothetical protein